MSAPLGAENINTTGLPFLVSAHGNGDTSIASLNTRDEDTVKSRYKQRYVLDNPGVLSWGADLAAWGNSIFAGITAAANNAITALTNIGNLAWNLLNSTGTAIGNIAGVVVDAVGSTLQNAWDWLTHLFNGGHTSGTPATGKNLSDVLTAADAVSTTTYNTQFSTETLQGFFNSPRAVPSWISNLSDDAAFAQTLIDGTTAPALGTLVLIPVTVGQDRVYDAIKFGVAATTMTNCYVGLYDVDETTGKCTKVIDLGDVKSQLSTTYNMQTINLGSTISVQKGELYYIGVLQVGGTAAAMHRWSTTFNFTTGFYPRYIGNTYSTTGIGALPASFNAGTAVISGTKYWGALGTATAPVAPGSAFYSDSFSSSMANWTLRNGTALTASGGVASLANSSGEMTYNQRLVQTEQEVGANSVGLYSGTGPGGSMGTVRLTLRGNGLGSRVWLSISDNNSGSTKGATIYTGTSYGDSGTSRVGASYTTSGDWVFRAVGNTYTAYLNGVQHVQWIDSGGSYIYTPSYTEVGIAAGSNNARGMRLDNWYGRDL